MSKIDINKIYNNSQKELERTKNKFDQVEREKANQFVKANYDEEYFKARILSKVEKNRDGVYLIDEEVPNGKSCEMMHKQIAGFLDQNFKGVFARSHFQSKYYNDDDFEGYCEVEAVWNEGFWGKYVTKHKYTKIEKDF